jgi:hypothetical protein
MQDTHDSALKSPLCGMKLDDFIIIQEYHDSALMVTVPSYIYHGCLIPATPPPALQDAHKNKRTRHAALLTTTPLYCKGTHILLQWHEVHTYYYKGTMTTF